MTSLLLSFAKAGQNGAKAGQAGFQVFYDLLRQLVGFRQIVEVGETLILQPEDIEAGFITGCQFLVGVPTPAAFRVLPGIPRCFSLVPILRVVAVDELGQMLKTERLLLQRVVDVGAVLLAPSNEPARLATGIDLRLLAFTSLLSLLTVLVCGLLPALRLSRTDVHTVIKSDARLRTAGSGRMTKALVASQVALSLMLVVGALLFTRTLVNLLSSYLGFNPNSVLVARVDIQHSGEARSLLPVWSALLRHVHNLPGVEQASLSSSGLFTGETPMLGIRTTAVQSLPTDPTTGRLFVSAGYFQTLDIRIASGRDFEPQDNNSGSPMCVIVNEAFVRKFLGSENPLGRKLTQLANAPVWTEIVGIVKDAKFSSLRENPPPMIYLPYGRITDWIPRQAHPGESMFLQVRGQQSRSESTR